MTQRPISFSTKQTSVPEETADREISGIIACIFAVILRDVPVVKAIRIILQKSDSSQWKDLKIQPISDEDIITFFDENENMRNLCLNICSTCQLFTNFDEGIQSSFNDDSLKAFSTYGKLKNKDGECLTKSEARGLDVRSAHIASLLSDADAIRVELALQQMIIEVAGKGVDGKVINMPRGCHLVTFSVMNSSPTGIGNQNQDPAKPVYNVFIAYATNVIGNGRIENSDSFGDLNHIGTRVFKFEKPSKETLFEVMGCVRVTQLDCLKKCRPKVEEHTGYVLIRKRTCYCRMCYRRVTAENESHQIGSPNRLDHVGLRRKCRYSKSGCVKCNEPVCATCWVSGYDRHQYVNP